MGNDKTLSAKELEDLAETASTLVDLARQQQYDCGELLRKLGTEVNRFESRTAELVRNMPNDIAQQAAKDVVKSIDASVTQSVAAVLGPVETKVQTLLSALEEPVATYRRVAQHWIVRHPVVTIILFACLSGLVSAILVVLAARYLLRATF
jgi:hypothetical protein